MIGEFSGKIRSTPYPKETFRTVNVEETPLRLVATTTPSKTWMRYLSPSWILTWTRTVSPGRKAGRSVRVREPQAASIGFMTHIPSALVPSRAAAAGVAGALQQLGA